MTEMHLSQFLTNLLQNDVCKSKGSAKEPQEVQQNFILFILYTIYIILYMNIVLYYLFQVCKTPNLFALLKIILLSSL